MVRMPHSYCMRTSGASHAIGNGLFNLIACFRLAFTFP
jgi:hypothetical protein